MPKITIEIPNNLENKIPKNSEQLTKVFLLGLKQEKAHASLQKLKKLKGILKKAYPDMTSVNLQHKAKNLW